MQIAHGLTRVAISFCILACSTTAGKKSGLRLDPNLASILDPFETITNTNRNISVPVSRPNPIEYLVHPMAIKMVETIPNSLDLGSAMLVHNTHYHDGNSRIAK